MKNFTNNFKQFTSRLSARWLIMALMMLLGTSSAWADKVFYLDLSGFTSWKDGNAKFSVNYFGGGVTQSFTGFATSVTIDGKSYYKATGIPDAATTIIWVRHNSSASTPDWNNKWNQTGDLTISSANGKNVVKITDWGAGSWSSTVTECTPATITWKTISATMSKGSTQTISTTLTSGAGSVTYTSSDENVITVSGAKLTAVGNGTATITAKHSTVLSDYCTAESITKSVTVSTVIPSGTKLYFDFSEATTWGTGHYLSIVGSANSSHYANNSHTDGVGQGNYKPKSDATWVALTKECDGIYSYTTTSDITTGISLWAANLSTYDDVWQTDVILNIKAADFDQTETCYTLGSTSTRHDDRQTDCFGGSWGSTIPVCCTPVEDSQYTIDDTEYTWDGTAKKPTVSANTADAGTPTSTVYKQGDTEVENPINVGTYDVYVSSNDGATYCGANNLNVGSFEIKCKGGNASDLYTLTKASEEYVGAPRGTGVTPVNGAGTASIIYKQGNTEVSPINVGIYDVYITSEAGTGYCAITTPTKIGTFEVTCRTATASQYTISQTSFAYDGSAKKPTVSKASGAAGEVTKTVYKQGDTTVDNPINAGTYDIYITTGSGTGYCALTNFKLGSFTINGKDPLDSDFTYTNSKNYTGSALSADVAWKTGLAAGVGGAITTYYKVEGAADNTYTTTVPTAVGTYTVAVTTAAGGNYAAATEKIVLGEFTINEVCEPINGLYWEIDDEDEKDIYCPGDEVTVTMTYNGSTAKDYEWGGDYIGNIGILGGSIASGAQYTMTINKSGSVNLTLTGCNGATPKTSTLTFEVVEAPVKPTISFSANPVGQNKPTTLTVGEYNGTLNNYTLYKKGVSQGAYTTPQTITIGDVGEYDYHVVATSKACPSLTATSETVTLEVQEAGAKIVQLGDLTIYTNIKTDFVPMYVQKDGIVDVDGATSVKGYTWQYSQDGNSWSNCTTNYASGVVGMSNGGADCNNWRADKAGRYRCLITYNNDGTQYSNVLSVSAATTTAPAVNAFGDLPIVSVNTGSNSFPDECSVSNNQYPSANADEMKKKVSVDVKIYDKAGKLQYDRKARMNYRGSSSLNFKKKSYAFVTGKEKTKNDKGDVDTGKANLFGLSNSCEDKDWVLYAATPDPSMMRNRLVFDLYKKMTGEWGVNSMYVELIVNNEYKGVYVLMDKITNNENRVNITASGGFIVKFDKTDVVDRVENAEGDQKTFATTRTGTGRAEWHPNGITSYDVKIDQRFEIEYPEKEDVEDAGGNWEATYGAIQKRFEDFETALEEKDYTTVRSIIDYDSWADWFIINEYTKNMDAYRASCIFVYNGNKIEARPLWDQELSFNNVVANIQSVGANSTSGLLIQNDGVYSDAFKAPFWFTGGGTSITGGLLNDPCFVSLVKQKWATYKEGVLSSNEVNDMVDNYTTELTSNAITRENTMLNFNSNTRGQTSSCTGSKAIGYYGYGNNTGSATTHDNSRNAIKSWITSRIPALTTAINGLEGEALIFTVSPSTVETTPWQQVILTVNAPEGYEYTVDYSELTAAGAIIKEGNNTYGIKIPRPDGWGTAGNGGPDDSEEYEFIANIEVSGENACGTMQEGTATSTITLKDVTEECSPEVKP